MTDLVDKFVQQTVTQVEVLKYSDGTTRHRLVKAFSTIIGEEKVKKPKKQAVEATMKSVVEEYFEA